MLIGWFLLFLFTFRFGWQWASMPRCLQILFRTNMSLLLYYRCSGLTIICVDILGRLVDLDATISILIDTIIILISWHHLTIIDFTIVNFAIWTRLWVVSLMSCYLPLSIALVTKFIFLTTRGDLVRLVMIMIVLYVDNCWTVINVHILLITLLFGSFPSFSRCIGYFLIVVIIVRIGSELRLTHILFKLLVRLEVGHTLLPRKVLLNGLLLVLKHAGSSSIA